MPNDTYTHGHEEPVVTSHRRRSAKTSAAYLLPHIEPGMTMLDVGCETGNITKDFAVLAAPGGSVTGIDIDEAMIEVARRGYGSVDGLSFVGGSVYSLPFDDGSFDIVHAHQVLQHLSDPVAALREMARVAKKGGLVAVRETDYSSRIWYPPSPEVAQWLALYRAVAHANGAEPDAGPHLLAWAHAAGLRDIEAGGSADIQTGDKAREWGYSWAGRCRESAFGHQAIEQGRATREDLEGIAQGWIAWGEHPDAWMGSICGEIIAHVR